MTLKLPHRHVAAVAFDCDGLMFNTEEAFHTAGVELLARRGLELTPAVHQLMMGRRAEEAFDRLIEALELPDTRDDLAAEYESIFHAKMVQILAVMPGLLELLDLLDEHDIPKAVCTSSTHAHLSGLLEQFSLNSRFPIRLTAEDVARGKPHPEIYLSAAKQLEIEPQAMLVLEDSENGTRAAAAAGAIAVCVPHQHSRKHDLSAAWLIAESLADERLISLITTSARNGQGHPVI